MGYPDEMVGGGKINGELPLLVLASVLASEGGHFWIPEVVEGCESREEWK